MSYRPTVIYFYTHKCKFCKRFEREVLRPMYERGLFRLVSIEIKVPEYFDYIDEIPSMMKAETLYHEEYIRVGNMVDEYGPRVPTVKIIPPDGNERKAIYLIPEVGSKFDEWKKLFEEEIMKLIRRYSVKPVWGVINE